MTDHMELVGRATEASDLRDRIMNPNIAKSEAEWWASREIERLEACIREMVEKREGLEEDLYSAVSVAYRRGAMEWARRNYPQWSKWIEEGRACLPPAPGAEV